MPRTPRTCTRPLRGLRQSRSIRLAMLLGASALAACGGGGGADTTDAAAATRNTALSAFTPAGAMPQNFRAPVGVPLALVEQLAQRLPSVDGPRYLRIWAASPGGGAPEVLYLGRWRPGQTPPPVHPQAAMNVLQVELYDARGAASGAWSLR